VERIVLFIDDLDRCPPDRVVEVLQAVHLLLAFRLFVVVVGVDSRWIESCLKEKHRQILADQKDATPPIDYLEKIFQIPYWLSPFTRVGAGQYFRSLVDESGAPIRETAVSPTANAGGATNPGNSSGTSGTDGDSFMIDEVQRGPVSWTNEELEFVSGLAPVAGRTPRATKRFFNLYNLLRHHPLLWPSLEERALRSSSDETFKAFAFALAVSNSGKTGASVLAQTLLDQSAGSLKPRPLLPEGTEVFFDAGWQQLRSAGDGARGIVEIALRLSFHGHVLAPDKT
jgi:hypothetical protein